MTTRKKETREERHTGKRLAAINDLLDAYLESAPLPATPPILHVVAAFGLNASQGECQTQRQHDRAWASLDAKDKVGDFSEGYWDWETQIRGDKTKAKTFTREQLLWQHITPLLRRRLTYRIHRDLLPAWKQADMERIAKLTGFDYDAEWGKICVVTLPVPKSWGADIDTLTLLAEASIISLRHSRMSSGGRSLDSGSKGERPRSKVRPVYARAF